MNREVKRRMKKALDDILGNGYGIGKKGDLLIPKKKKKVAPIILAPFMIPLVFGFNQNLYGANISKTENLKKKIEENYKFNWTFKDKNNEKIELHWSKAFNAKQWGDEKKTGWDKLAHDYNIGVLTKTKDGKTVVLGYIGVKEDQWNIGTLGIGSSTKKLEFDIYIPEDSISVLEPDSAAKIVPKEAIHKMQEYDLALSRNKEAIFTDAANYILLLRSGNEIKKELNLYKKKINKIILEVKNDEKYVRKINSLEVKIDSLYQKLQDLENSDSATYNALNSLVKDIDKLKNEFETIVPKIKKLEDRLKEQEKPYEFNALGGIGIGVRSVRSINRILNSFSKSREIEYPLSLIVRGKKENNRLLLAELEKNNSGNRVNIDYMPIINIGEGEELLLIGGLEYGNIVQEKKEIEDIVSEGRIGIGIGYKNGKFIITAKYYPKELSIGTRNLDIEEAKVKEKYITHSGATEIRVNYTWKGIELELNYENGSRLFIQPDNIGSGPVDPYESRNYLVMGVKTRIVLPKKILGVNPFFEIGAKYSEEKHNPSSSLHETGYEKYTSGPYIMFGISR